MNHLVKEEILAQANALQAMHGDKMALIDEHAPLLRKIVEQVREDTGKVPTVNDLLWIASEHVGRDLREEK